jgi:hypothetical protein
MVFSALLIGLWVVSGLSFVGIITGGFLTSSAATYTAGIAVLATCGALCVVSSLLAGCIGYKHEKGDENRSRQPGPEMEKPQHMHTLFDDAGMRLHAMTRS